MSKKFKGKICTYCVEAKSTTADHIFAKKFFLPDARADLPQVPACKICNGRKSKLEHYLMTILPFGGRHDSALHNLSQMVPRRLARNVKLNRKLRDNWGRTWSNERGIHVPVSTLPVDVEAVEQLFEFISRGLVFFHWGIFIRREHAVKVMALASAGEKLFDSLFAINATARVKNDLGNGTFRYEGVQALDVPENTAWRVQIYGGLKLGDPASPGEVSSSISVLTGPWSITLEA